jgi:hypothetical protein
MTDRPQLAALAKPFPASLIQKNPTGFGEYVKHSVVVEKLLATVGPFDFRIVREIRDADTGQICGVIGELTVEIDGRVTLIQEAGDCERMVNWPHDGARLKDACSDAIKRCAARIGVGTHLWSQDQFRLDRALERAMDRHESSEAS